MGNCKVFLYHFISAGEESKWRKVLLGPLYLLSLLYGWIVSLRVRFYSWNIFRIHSLPCKVVSVGNITLGGTGKTPVCLPFSRTAEKQGIARSHFEPGL